MDSCPILRVHLNHKPNHISRTVLPIVKIGPPSWIRTASNRDPCHTRYSLSVRLPKVDGEAFGHSFIPFAEMTLGFRCPGVCSAGPHFAERPAPPEYLQGRFPRWSPLAAMRPTQQVGVVFSFDAELEVRIGDWPSTPATGSAVSNRISQAASHQFSPGGRSIEFSASVAFASNPECGDGTNGTQRTRR